MKVFGNCKKSSTDTEDSVLSMWGSSCFHFKFDFFSFRPVCAQRIKFYRPPTKLWEGNVFRGVCHSVRGWVSPVPCPFQGVYLIPSSFRGWVCTAGGYPVEQVTMEYGLQASGNAFLLFLTLECIQN